MLYIFRRSRRYHQEKFVYPLWHHTAHHATRLFAGIDTRTIHLVFVKVTPRPVFHKGHITQVEAPVGIIRRLVVSRNIGSCEFLSIEILGRIAVGQRRTVGKRGKIGRDFSSRLRNIQPDDIEARTLRTTAITHLVFCTTKGHIVVTEGRNVAAGLVAYVVDIHRRHLHGVQEILHIQVRGTHTVHLHKALVRVSAKPRVIPPQFANCVNTVCFGKVIVPPVRLVAVPLVRHGIVVGVLEKAPTFVPLLVGERLARLPLCGLFPEGRTRADGRTETRIAFKISIDLVLERVPHLVSYRKTNRFAGTRTQPQGSDNVVVSASITHPFGSMVKQNQQLILRHVRLAFVAKCQFANIHSIETLALLQQIVNVYTIGPRRISWIGIAIVLIPKDNKVLTLFRARFRPSVLVARVVLAVDKGVLPVLPFLGDINAFLCR